MIGPTEKPTFRERNMEQPANGTKMRHPAPSLTGLKPGAGRVLGRGWSRDLQRSLLLYAVTIRFRRARCSKARGHGIRGLARVTGGSDGIDFDKFLVYVVCELLLGGACLGGD